MKIEYQVNHLTGYCTTPCPYSTGIKVGSVGCYSCAYNDETNDDEQWVECHRAAHEGGVGLCSLQS